MATAPALSELDMATSDILAGRFTHSGFYSDAEWRDAATRQVNGDDADLTFMLEREDAFERFGDWQYRGGFISHHEANRREFTDFDDWMAGEGK